MEATETAEASFPNKERTPLFATVTETEMEFSV
jgi:hypothetical protein